ncbi:MAG: LysR family transcriptional regulator [Polaromonas sp.]|nr:LysR family transcriptional regulator [Polaromonas sp.]
MKLAHLEVCNAVLLAGTVTGAARLLHMSQPAVTKMLQSAENQFGFKLFTREKNRLVPTPEALDLHPEILQIACQIDRLREFSRALVTEKSSFLRIDCPPSIAATFLPACIENFSALYPNVSCQVETHTQTDIINRLMHRQCDIGFSLASLPNPAVIEEVIVQGCGVCVVPHGILAQSKSSVTWKDLSSCRLIRVPPGGMFGGLTMEASHYTDELKPGSLAVSTNFLAMRMAERGLGIASIDSFTAASVDRSKARILVLSPSTAVEILALHRRLAKLSHAARHFIQIMAQTARQAHESLEL